MGYLIVILKNNLYIQTLFFLNEENLPHLPPAMAAMSRYFMFSRLDIPPLMYSNNEYVTGGELNLFHSVIHGQGDGN